MHNKLQASRHICHRVLIFTVVLFIHNIIPSFSDNISAPPSPSPVVSALLKFKEGLTDENGALESWSSSRPPCFGIKNNWVGIICSRGGSIWGLRLEYMRLSGSVNVDPLLEIPRLRSISVMNNSFGGPMPNIKQLKLLRAAFLSNNEFAGKIDPKAFEGLRRLRKVDLANNKFSGEIPNSLTILSKLVEVRLEGNQFQGPIPDFKGAKNLKVFNVSNNQLEGPIPNTLAKFDATSFHGNKEVCGPPIGKCPFTISSSISASPPAPPPTDFPLTLSPKSLSSSEKPIPIATIVVGVVVAMALVILIILMLLRNRCDTNEDRGSLSRSRGLSQARKSGLRKNIECPDDEGSHRSTASSGRHRGNPVDSGKLTFIDEDRPGRFDLPDLLKASAEILGSGSFGSCYKATMRNGNSVVVKRFKQMNGVKREEFQEHMRRLGMLSNPNLLPLVAYFYRKEEKLFINDPISNGSLALLLHGQSKGKGALDWPTRLKIIKGVTRGLSYLHKELHCLVVPHGHLKSSNVLINESFEPLLSDYGLMPLINPEKAHQFMVAYKSPEFINTGRVTKKTDVWSLGILIIETMTGNFPSAFHKQGNNHEVEMTSWITSVVEEGFDKNMGETTRGSNSSELGEMKKLLDIGVACCENDVEKRLEVNEVCDQIDEIRERDGSIEGSDRDDLYTTPETRSSRGMSDEFTTVSIN